MNDLQSKEHLEARFGAAAAVHEPTWAFFPGFFGESAPQRRRPVAQADLPGPDTYEVEVEDISYNQNELEKICGGCTEGSFRFETTAVLVLDDENSHDKKAVRVGIEGYLIGHLSWENVREYCKKLKEAGHPRITASCKAIIIGGWDRGQGNRGHFGVRLDLPTGEV